MSHLRRAARSDSTQRPIVAALRAAGAQVYVLGKPVDLLVRYRGKLYLGDCKPLTWKKPRKDQAAQTAWMEAWEVPVWRTPDDALSTIGAKE